MLTAFVLSVVYYYCYAECREDDCRGTEKTTVSVL